MTAVLIISLNDEMFAVKSFYSRLKVYFYLFQSSRPFIKQLRGSFSCAVAIFQCELQCLWKSLREIRLIWSLARGADPY